MAYRNGVYVYEKETALVALRQIDSVVPFVVGTAPIHLSGTGLTDTTKQIHYPVLTLNFTEVAARLGYSDKKTRLHPSMPIAVHDSVLAQAILQAKEIYRRQEELIQQVQDAETVEARRV